MASKGGGGAPVEGHERAGGRLPAHLSASVSRCPDAAGCMHMARSASCSAWRMPYCKGDASLWGSRIRPAVTI